MLALDDRATFRIQVDLTLAASRAPGKVQLRSKLALILASTMIAFVTSLAPAGDEERSSQSPLESIRDAYVRP
jgi:hypothetical protein